MSTTETTPKFDLYQTVTNRIIELLEKGVIPWRQPWHDAGPPMNAISKRPYQGINLWMLLCMNYESNLFLTWEQIKKIGGSVNKGEKGHLVVYWHIQDHGDNNEETIEDKEEQKSKRPLLRYHKVFNIEQCSGIPDSIKRSKYEREIDPILTCEKVVEGMPDKPRIMKGKRRAEYDPKMDYVNMPSTKHFDSSEAYYTTLFHELIHSTGHEKRLNRKTLTEMAEFGSEPYSIEELIAELGTCYLAAHSQILEKEVKNSAAYIKCWLSKLKTDKRFIVIASSQAQKACDYILMGKKKTVKNE